MIFFFTKIPFKLLLNGRFGLTTKRLVPPPPGSRTPGRTYQSPYRHLVDPPAGAPRYGRLQTLDYTGPGSGTTLV